MLATIIRAICMPLIFIFTFSLFGYFAKREEKRLSKEGEFKVKASKSVAIFFIVFIVGAFIGIIITIILMRKQPLAFWSITTLLILVIVLSIPALLEVAFNYLIANDKYIIVKKFFSKPRKIKYEDIMYYAYKSYFSKSNNVSRDTYYIDKNANKLFTVSFFDVGVNELNKKINGARISLGLEALRYLGNTGKYKNFCRIEKGKSYFFVFLIMTLLFIVCATLVFFGCADKPFENYRIYGVIYNAQIEEDYINISLHGDENTYTITNTIMDVTNMDVVDELYSGRSITLTIGYTNLDGYKIISGIEIDGITYLTPEVAEQKVREYNADARTLSGIMFAVGGAFLFASAICGIIALVFKKKLSAQAKN